MLLAALLAVGPTIAGGKLAVFVPSAIGAIAAVLAAIISAHGLHRNKKLSQKVDTVKVLVNGRLDTALKLVDELRAEIDKLKEQRASSEEKIDELKGGDEADQ